MGWTAAERNALLALAALGLAGLIALSWINRSNGIKLVAGDSRVPAEAAAGWDRALAQSRTVHLNTATAAELERLPEIGPALAQRIVDARERYGRFATADDLLQVPGIGEKTLNALRPFVDAE